MNFQTQVPTPASYWVKPGRFLAGEYPFSINRLEARQKFRQLLGAGASYFLDLTESGESGLEPYAPFLLEAAASIGRSVEHMRIAIPDFSTPSRYKMERILDSIDAALMTGHTVYVHCHAGIGRTGMVVGCFLVRHGMNGEDALKRIANLRQDTPGSWRPSPETTEQRHIVLEWTNFHGE